jgi:hypothetical protein
MATRTGKSRARIGTALLEQLADLDARSISPETAGKLLQLGFDAWHKRRAAGLAKKARDGSLRPDEKDELDEYIRAADLLAILQSRARQSLKNAGGESREQ